MNILALNGSPRGEHGNTEQMLQPFLNGARSAGAEIEAVYLRDKKINHCRGCFTCWFKTPGVCVFEDDMPELLEKLKRSEAVVYATPLYICSVSGLMKDFMDRSLPRLQPYIVKHGSFYRHPLRDGWKAQKVVLISSCGFPDSQYFSGIIETFGLVSSLNPDDEFAGAIVCAGRNLVNSSLREQRQWYFDACEAAGREFAGQGRISSTTRALLESLDGEPPDPEARSRIANARADSALAAIGDQ